MKRFALLVALVAGCAGAGPRYAGTVRVADSRLVPINPDVKTVIDADQPVFFAQGSYWLFADGRWFKSASPTGTWTYVAKPPVPVRQIDQPFAYVHYKKDSTGKEIETVASGFAQPDADPQPEERSRRPAPQPAGVDPTVDPTTNLAPAR